MKPELFEFLGMPIYSYRLLLAVAFVLCTLLAVRASERRSGGVRLVPLMGIWALGGALLGARTFYVLQYRSPAEYWTAMVVWEGGLVFYGGLLGGAAAVAIHWRLRGTPFLKGADVVAPYLALGEAITRIGCFLNGCCHGALTHVPWGMRFPPGSVAYQAQLDSGLITTADLRAHACHPTQLYMALGLLLVFGLLHPLRLRQLQAGFTVCGYLLLYGILRFLVEFLRGDSARSVFGMTVSQVISLALIIGAGSLLASRYFRVSTTEIP